uniref:Uncharacterized protein n=1 Tax=Panagrellus redivivus TaxID=6233 RepID=A0A7E4VPP6_PANRE
MSAFVISQATSAFLSLLAFFLVVTAQNFGARDPFAIRNTVPYNAYNDPYGNLGTRSTWQDQIVLHLFGRR